MTLLNDKQAYVAEVERRLLAIFNAYQDNKDVAPAILFRTEGFIEAGCELGLLTQEQAAALIATVWKSVFGQNLPESASKSIHIPVAMQRAPVYPSTSVDP